MCSGRVPVLSSVPSTLVEKDNICHKFIKMEAEADCFWLPWSLKLKSTELRVQEERGVHAPQLNGIIWNLCLQVEASHNFSSNWQRRHAKL